MKKSTNSLRWISKRKKKVALSLVLLFVSSMLPTKSVFALSGGPSQPEMTSFEPVSTNQMVDLFSGDVTYNIPLLDVGGYPINIAYQGGATMEQEASWVGLGWNINPGVVNRSVRGYPDDFQGEKVQKEMHLKKNKTIRFGGSVNTEAVGVKASKLGGDVIWNNYKGLYISPKFSLGISFGDNDQNTLTLVDYSGESGYDIGISLSFSGALNKKGLMGAASAGMTMNSRDRSVSYSVGANLSQSYKENPGDEGGKYVRGASATKQGRKKDKSIDLFSGGSSVQIGKAAYVPSGQPSMKNKSGSVSATAGSEAFGANPMIEISGLVSVQELAQSDVGAYREVLASGGTDNYDKAYGYLYLQKSDPEKDLIDYSREGTSNAYSKTTKNLPIAYLTYDLLSVSGQGASGSFRPFRNDIGLVGDQHYAVEMGNDFRLGVEFGGGNALKGGTSLATTWGLDSGGKWMNPVFKDYKFSETESNSFYENTYFKSAGEKTPTEFDAINGTEPIAFGVHGQDAITPIPVPAKREYVGSLERVIRGKYISYLTYEEAITKKMALDNDFGFITHNGTDFVNAFLPSSNIQDRNGRQPYHISEITHTEKDGSRYVFGISAYNTMKREVSFAIESSNPSGGLTSYSPTDDVKVNNGNGKDEFFQEIETAPYAHSYLLTGYLSPDYVDVTGDGITSDDLGNGVRFDWFTPTDETTGAPKTVGWRSPSTGTTKASYSKGMHLNEEDDKGSYVYGKKELWYLKQVVSKNHIAIFELEDRTDSYGVTEEGLKNTSQPKKKLNSITLYHMADFDNNAAPKELKKVVFDYDYSLCPGTPTSGSSGKLTLNKIEIFNGTNSIPSAEYSFSYNNENYAAGEIDRWGNCKTNSGNGIFEKPSASLSEIADAYAEYPYVNQDASEVDHNNDASAWLLSKIELPSGGEINIDYEADRYAYVQDKIAQRFYKVIGAGNDNDASKMDNKLYRGGPFMQNDYLFIRLPTGVSTSQTGIDNYFKGIDRVYWKFDIKPLRSEDIHEPITGYAAVEDYGLAQNATNVLYVKLKREEVNKGRDLNPITAKSFKYLEQNLSDYIGVGGKPTDGPFLTIAKQYYSYITDLYQLVAGPVNFNMTKGIAEKFDASQSYLKLNMPSDAITNKYIEKFGGGHRVKKVELSDGWGNMTSELESKYGQIYKYINEDGTSSGVASYEPLTGGDESPMRSPAYFDDPNKPLFMSGEEQYEELPFGESLFPTGSVGYSRVVTESIHKSALSRSSQNYQVKEFYTSKDFPYQFDYTDIDQYDSENKLSSVTSLFGVGRQDYLTASQGYAIVMNDMHGKERSSKEYVVIRDSQGIETDILVSGTEYKYKTKVEKGLEVLDHKVDAINPYDRAYNPNLQMGLDVDVTIDTKYAEHFDESPTMSVNTDGFIAGLLPVVIPTMFKPGTHNESKLRNVVVTKVVQEYGILSEVVNYTDNRRVSAYNVFYDAHTGEPVVTKQKNEFERDIYTYNMPAYWAIENDRMGPAYINTGYYETGGDKILVMNECSDPYVHEYMRTQIYKGFVDANDWYGTKIYGNLMTKDVFVRGDEVLNKDVDHTTDDTTYKRLWVVDVIDQFKLAEWRLKGLISSFNNITGINDNDIVGNCSKISSEAEFKSKMANLSGIAESKVGDISTSLFNYGDQNDACRWKSYFSTGYTSKNTSLNSLKMADFFSDYSTGIMCDFLNDLYDKPGGANKNIYILFKELFDNTNVEATKNYMEALMSNQDLLEYAICNTKYPAIFDVLKLTMCDQKFFNMLRFTLENEDKEFYVFTDVIIGEEEGGEGIELPDPESKTEFKLRELFETYGCNSQSLLENVNGVSMVPFPSPSPNYFSLHEPKLKSSISNKRINRFNCVQATENAGCVSRSARTIAQSGDFYDTNPTSLQTQEECRPFGTRSFNAATYDVVIFMDRDGKIADVESEEVKILRSGRRNQLTSSLASISSFDKNPFTNAAYKFNVLNSTATSFSDQWLAEVNDQSILAGTEPIYPSYRTATEDQEKIPNPFIFGILGNFKPYQTFQYQDRRSRTTVKDNVLYDDGVMNQMFVPFWINSTSSGDYVVRNDNTLVDGLWINSVEVTNYSTLGSPVQELNPLGIYSSEMIGNHTKAEIVAGNAQLKEVAFDSFEEYLDAGSNRQSHSGLRNFASTPSSMSCFFTEQTSHSGSTSLFIEGLKTGSNYSYWKEIASAGSGPGYTTENEGGIDRHYEKIPFPHCSGSTTTIAINLNVKTGEEQGWLNDDYRNPVFRIEPGKEYIISGWIKSGYPSHLLFYDVNQFVSKPSTIQADVHLVMNASTTIDCLDGIADQPEVEGWQRFEKVFTASSPTVSSASIVFYGGDYGCFVDDIRIYPKDAKVNTHVYDVADYKLKASLDENNYATFYEYDNMGNLVRIKKETERGIVTVVEYKTHKQKP